MRTALTPTPRPRSPTLTLSGARNLEYARRVRFASRWEREKPWRAKLFHRPESVRRWYPDNDFVQFCSRMLFFSSVYHDEVNWNAYDFFCHRLFIDRQQIILNARTYILILDKWRLSKIIFKILRQFLSFLYICVRSRKLRDLFK